MTAGRVPDMKRILVAEDRAAGREWARAVLSHSGYEVILASDGLEAVAKARTESPDLVILDLRMPGLDGFETLRTLRADERFASTPFLAFTANAMQGDRERAMAEGFDGYVSKPVSIAGLRAEVERLLTLRT